MKYHLTPHARSRMVERAIPERFIHDALDDPTKVGYDPKGRWLIKKLYTKNGTERLLIIVGEVKSDTLKIITVIDTSKTKKYL